MGFIDWKNHTALSKKGLNAKGNPRVTNADWYYVNTSEGILYIADGVSSERGAERASRVAVNEANAVIKNMLKEGKQIDLPAVMEHVNSKVIPIGRHTTLSLVVLPRTPGEKASYAHIGDGVIWNSSTAQHLVPIQGFGHYLHSALGSRNSTANFDFNPVYGEFTLKKGSILILGTDGLVSKSMLPDHIVHNTSDGQSIYEAQRRFRSDLFKQDVDVDKPIGEILNSLMKKGHENTNDDTTCIVYKH
jgi:serine/threonine protein phosphatase PrpC